MTEELGYDFSGDGEHDYLYIRKRGANTEWVARQLARFAKVAAKDVGYSGLKDRHAVTRQWFVAGEVFYAENDSNIEINENDKTTYAVTARYDF